MEQVNMNSEVKAALILLGFSDLKQFPKLKDVRKEFFCCARKCHRDKNSNSDRKTKEEKKKNSRNF